MTPAEAKAATDVIATMWQGEFRATSEVLAAVKDDNRNYKPDAKSRTAWELATHLATADIWFIDSIMKGAFEWDPEAAKRAEGQFKNVNDIVAFYKKTFPEKLKGLQAMPGEKLAEILCVDANARILNFNSKHIRGLVPGANADSAILRREFNRIGEVVVENLLQLSGIQLHVSNSRVKIGFHSKLFTAAE